MVNESFVIPYTRDKLSNGIWSACAPTPPVPSLSRLTATTRSNCAAQRRGYGTKVLRPGSDRSLHAYYYVYLHVYVYANCATRKRNCFCDKRLRTARCTQLYRTADTQRRNMSYNFLIGKRGKEVFNVSGSHQISTASVSSEIWCFTMTTRYSIQVQVVLCFWSVSCIGFTFYLDPN